MSWPQGQLVFDSTPIAGAYVRTPKKKINQTRGPDPGHGAVTGVASCRPIGPQLLSPRTGRVERHDDVTVPDKPGHAGPSLRAAGIAPVANSATEGPRFCLGTRTNAEPVPGALQSATSALPIRPGRAIAFRESDHADRRRAGRCLWRRSSRPGSDRVCVATDDRIRREQFSASPRRLSPAVPLSRVPSELGRPALQRGPQRMAPSSTEGSVRYHRRRKPGREVACRVLTFVW